MFSSGLTGVSSTPASTRTDDRLTLAYTWIHPSPKHQLRVGADYRLTRSTAEHQRERPRHVRLHGSLRLGRHADPGRRLRRLPPRDCRSRRRCRSAARARSASTRSTASSKTTGRRARSSRSTSACATSSRCRTRRSTAAWRTSTRRRTSRPSPRWCPARSARTRARFPRALLNTDTNNLGPRLGFAYRLRPSTILRGGYSITYNSSSVRVDRARARGAAAFRRHRNDHRIRSGAAHTRRGAALHALGPDDEQLGRRSRLSRSA